MTLSLTYRPKKRRRARVHGFLKRSRTNAGRRVIRSRRRKKRQRLAV
ncbi:MAG: 50S ribosomal protein L34 [bacterium]|nr:50S ribosomal protein L34 [bacterium]